MSPNRARLTAQDKALRAITEKQWQKTVLDLLDMNGYLTWHDTANAVPRGLDANGKVLYSKVFVRRGLPDVIAVRDDPPDFFFAELKREKGSELREDQKVWIAALKAAGIPAYVLRPSDLEWLIERTKRR